MPTDRLRRRIVIAGGATFATSLVPASWADEAVVSPPAPPELQAGAFLAELERRTFDFFWETTPANGLAHDRWPSESFSSIAAIGFALTAYLIGAERGWVAREAAVQRVQTTLDFFLTAPQGKAIEGMAGYQGFFYHFLDAKTGTRFGRTELSTVDTALLMCGMLACQSYFDGTGAAETKLRHGVDAIYERIDWTWAMVRPPLIGHGWHPEGGHIPWDWRAYDESLMVYLIALGSPRSSKKDAVKADSYAAWARGLPDAWGSEWGQTFARFPPLFGHQFTQCWFDLRGVQDDFFRAKEIDFFENSRRATLAQRAYAMANPLGWRGYGPDCWGITACDGPADVTRTVDGRPRTFHSYAGRGVGGKNWDDGTLAPYGAGSSIVFTPEESTRALLHMRQTYGEHLYGRYGFTDAFNPTFRFPDVKLDKGQVVPDLGWFDTDMLGIDQGPLLAMLANHRDGVVWRACRRNPHIKRGLLAAGMRGGWLG